MFGATAIAAILLVGEVCQRKPRILHVAFRKVMAAHPTVIVPLSLVLLAVVTPITHRIDSAAEPAVLRRTTRSKVAPQMALIACVLKGTDAANIHLSGLSSTLGALRPLVMRRAVCVIAHPVRQFLTDSSDVLHRTTTGRTVHLNLLSSHGPCFSTRPLQI